MKKLILLLLICSAAYSNTSFDIILTIDGYVTNYELSSKDHQSKANLDCQSFLHKFDLYNEDGNLVSENFIDQRECDILSTKINICLKEHKIVCFRPESIYDSNCHCN